MKELQKRLFESRKTECSAGCKYCFGKWENYTLFKENGIIEDNAIIYPNCDGNFFDEYFLESVDKIKEIRARGIVISISTKHVISDKQLLLIEEANKYLQNSNRGFIKLSISFSCAESIFDIEPGTSLYNDRIEQIRKIVKKDIPYVTIIKPILPFVKFDEYKRIIDDTILYSPNYVLGDLYIDEKNAFYKQYIKGKYHIYYRTVSWNNNNWGVVESLDIKKRIVDYIEMKGGNAYQSDIEAVMNIRHGLFDEK